MIFKIEKAFLVFVILFLILRFNFKAQNHQIDSLLKITEVEKQDTNYVKNLIQLSALYTKNQSFSLAKKIAQRALTCSELINNNNAIARSYIVYGSAYTQSHNTDSAAYMYNKALKSLSGNGNEALKFTINTGLASNYISKGNFELALSCLFINVKICERINYQAGLIQCYYGIGDIYRYRKSHKKALIFFNRAIAIAEKIEDAENSLAMISNAIGVTYSEMNKKDEAIKFYNKALQQFEVLDKQKGKNSSYGISLTLNNIATIYIEQGTGQTHLN